MSEMVERVATAIEECPEWPAKTYRERVARAAIEALREPTPDMLADEDVSASWRGCPTCVGLRDGWRAMIDLALKP